MRLLDCSGSVRVRCRGQSLGLLLSLLSRAAYRTTLARRPDPRLTRGKLAPTLPSPLPPSLYPPTPLQRLLPSLPPLSLLPTSATTILSTCFAYTTPLSRKKKKKSSVQFITFSSPDTDQQSVCVGDWCPARTQKRLVTLAGLITTPAQLLWSCCSTSSGTMLAA